MYRVSAWYSVMVYIVIPVMILYYNFIYKCVQILRALNPGIKFKPNKDSRQNIKGVAIILNEYLLLVDRYDIEHEDESVIRKRLRTRKDTVTTSKQYFLMKNHGRLQSAELKQDVCLASAFRGIYCHNQLYRQSLY